MWCTATVEHAQSCHPAGKRNDNEISAANRLYIARVSSMPVNISIRWQALPQKHACSSWEKLHVEPCASVSPNCTSDSGVLKMTADTPSNSTLLILSPVTSERGISVSHGFTSVFQSSSVRSVKLCLLGFSTALCCLKSVSGAAMALDENIEQKCY